MNVGHVALRRIEEEIADCRRCPRLVAWRERVAREKRAAYQDWEYWGRGVPGFGDPDATILIVGLAPAAHGANRTGRMFTGDRSGDWLYRALAEAGLANQAESVDRDDGLHLQGVYVSAVVRCAPPENKPTPKERDTCVAFLGRELDALRRVRVVVALGAFAYQALLRRFDVRPRPPFRHGAEVELPDGRVILCSFHPSQRNTFTGKLTESMLRAVFVRARALAAE